MITTYALDEHNHLVPVTIAHPNPVWIDIFRPKAKEKKQLEAQLELVLPQHNEMHQIEFSNRFYEECNALFLSVNVITAAYPDAETHVLTFILRAGMLITLRYSDPDPVTQFMDHLKVHEHPIENHLALFHLLLDKISGRVADTFEMVEVRAEQVSQTLLTFIDQSTKKPDRGLNQILHDLNILENLVTKGYQSLTSLGLLTAYIMEQHKKLFPEPFMKDLASLNEDIKNLLAHGEYLSHKLGFQLQSSFGLINVEQTQIIKMFTVLAMIFMPPTLIASIYGMNFHHMPELNAKVGYPLALVIMVISALIPFVFFKRKGWI